MGAILKALQVIGVIAAFPPVEGLWGDAKVAAGKTSMVTVGIVVIKPLESLPGSF